MINVCLIYRQDEAYLSQMQRDRQEMLAMQRQLQLMGDDDVEGEGDGSDEFDDRYYVGTSGYADHDASMMFQFNGENEFTGEIDNCFMSLYVQRVSVMYNMF